MKEKYYLIEKEMSNEGFILFWKKKAKGYTINLEEAGLFDFTFVGDYYLGQSDSTLAIEKDKFEKMMKTFKIVWNFSDFYEMINKK